MGEVMLSSEDFEVKESENVEKAQKGGESSKGLVSWERFLPKMSLRVLLVEADDSTRQIVSALLRKCSYKVTSVSDGLKAWEVLKGMANTIDLILTEVEIPSISGYALLTLIMENETCRNIPVIMMSQQDSINTVYKCMQTGASDYLVKPLRINELRNLWQHVWRRQIAANVENQAQNESAMQEEVEATSKNNAASRHSSDRECVRRNQDYMDRGREAQSSCTKPGLVDENEDMESVHFMQSDEGKSFLSDAEMQKHERFIKGDLKDGNATPSVKDVGSETPRRDTNIASEDSDDNDALINPTRETAGSAGAFNVLPNCRYEGSLNCGTSKLDSSPLLNLSLRSSHPSGIKNKASEERRTLNHSRTSPFTQYVKKPLQHRNSTIGSTNDQHKEDTVVSNTYKSDHLFVPLGTEKVVGSLATGQSEQSNFRISCPEAFPVPVPLRGVHHDNMCSSYPQFPPIYHLQSGGSHLTIPSSAGQKESLYMTAVNQSITVNSNSGQCHGQTNLAHNVIDQSANSSLSVDGDNQLNKSGLVSACGNSICTSTDMRTDESARRASLRKAALIKFCQKRKDRCYEKKVRYESRKKLAEQRPRVKGQFVRHVHTDTTIVDPEYQNLNSLDG